MSGNRPLTRGAIKKDPNLKLLNPYEPKRRPSIHSSVSSASDSEHEHDNSSTPAYKPLLSPLLHSTQKPEQPTEIDQSDHLSLNPGFTWNISEILASSTSGNCEKSNEKDSLLYNQDDNNLDETFLSAGESNRTSIERPLNTSSGENNESTRKSGDLTENLEKKRNGNLSENHSNTFKIQEILDSKVDLVSKANKEIEYLHESFEKLMEKAEKLSVTIKLDSDNDCVKTKSLEDLEVLRLKEEVRESRKSLTRKTQKQSEEFTEFVSERIKGINEKDELENVGRVIEPKSSRNLENFYDPKVIKEYQELFELNEQRNRTKLREIEIEKELFALRDSQFLKNRAESLQFGVSTPISHLKPNNPQLPYKMSNTHQITTDIKEALKGISEFDGKNISVLQFIDACEEARESIDEIGQERLVKLFRTKVTGAARRVIRKIPFATCEEFYKKLKSRYAPARPAHELLGELGNITQESNETVSEFVERIQEKADLIADARQTEEGELTQQHKKEIERSKLYVLEEGLNEDIRTRIKKWDIFDDTVNEAIIIESRIKGKLKLEKKSTGKSKPVLVCAETPVQTQDKKNASVNTAGGNPKKPTLPCQICNRTNHIASNCNYRFSHTVNLVPGNPQNAPINTYTMNTQNAGQPNGQNFVQQGPGLRAPREPCQICNRPSHDASRCWLVTGRPTPQNPQPRFQPNSQQPNQTHTNKQTIVCQICKQIGHDAKTCPSVSNLAQNFPVNNSNLAQNFPVSNGNNNNMQQRDPFLCHRCGKPGHVARFCRSPIIYPQNFQQNSGNAMRLPQTDVQGESNNQTRQVLTVNETEVEE